MTTPKISAVIIAYNEEAAIARTLASVAWCDEITVVDSCSTDRTVEVCRRHGAAVFERPFTGYGEQKRFAVSKASNDWVLSIDADEEVSEKLRDEIRSYFAGGEVGCEGFSMPIILVFCGRALRHYGRRERPKLRLFNRRCGNFNLKKVHESVELAGTIRRLRGEILHYSYDDISDYFRKFNSYTSAAAREYLDKGRPPSKMQVYLRFPLEFVKSYVLHLSFMDGYPGFVWSIFSAMYPVVKYAKLLELDRRRREVSKASR